MSPQGAAAEAEELVALGFRALKVKIGRGDLAQDLTTIHAVRGAVGAEIKLMVDYNQSQAMDRIQVLDEEPTRANDLQGHAILAATARTAIQLGENWWGPHEMAKSIAAGAPPVV